MIRAETIQDLRNKVRGLKSNRLVEARDLAFNRMAMEQNLADALVFPAAISKDDRIKYLDTGLNLIATRIAAKNNVVIALDIEKLRGLDQESLGQALAKVMQNIEICSKSKTKLGYLKANSPAGAQALLRTLGASTKQASEAISF